MAKRPVQITALMLAVAVLMSGCSHDIELKEISADLIPEEYKASLSSLYRDELVPGSVVWRVCKDYPENADEHAGLRQTVINPSQDECMIDMVVDVAVQSATFSICTL